MTVALTLEPRTVRFARYTPQASYTTGGEAVTAAEFKLSRLDHLVISSGGEGGFVFAYDPSAGKIMAFYADNDAVADSALIQVPAATNVSGSPIDVIAIGLP
jgi:hypothetical protein